MVKHRKPKASTPNSQPGNGKVAISEEEQWRLINETGVLQKATKSANETSQVEEEQDSSLADEIFNSVLLIIPFSFLLLMMEILIHFQYAQQPTFKSCVDRLISGVPILSVFIFYTTRYKQRRWMQFFLSLLCIAAGSRLVYMINRGSWLSNMRQCPPLATVCIYAVVQLDLGLAAASLLIMAGWIRWSGMKLIL